MTREEAKWWANHLFEIRKEEYFNKGMMEDAKEVEEAQHMAIEALDKMAELPSIDIKTGKWEITSAYPHIVYCSECHKRYAQTNWAVWNDKDYPLPRNYCPNCGVKMEGCDG